MRDGQAVIGGKPVGGIVSVIIGLIRQNGEQRLVMRSLLVIANPIKRKCVSGNYTGIRCGIGESNKAVRDIVGVSGRRAVSIGRRDQIASAIVAIGDNAIQPIR